MTIKDILNDLNQGNVTVEQAQKLIENHQYEDLLYAKIDHGRKERSGQAEVVLCEGKPDEFLSGIYESIFKENGEVLGTRASMHQYELVKKVLPQVEYDSVSRILKIEKKKELKGNIVICTGGTADIPVAQEAAQTAQFFGSRVERIYDVGVAGIHRILSKKDKLDSANCIIAIAGMEGALASVVAGLARGPVIAVPTSIGYGANFGGMSALLCMINSCANGVSVVNIDNGYGAGYIANQINQLCERK